MEEQNRQTNDLRNALHHSQISEAELRIIVDGCLNHYFELFRVKATAAKADVLYIMSGMWKTSAERFFMWIGGFRPSELLKVINASGRIHFLLFVTSIYGLYTIIHLPA